MSEQNSSSFRGFSFNVRWVRWAGTIISSALFIWLLTQQDWSAMWETTRQIPIWLIPLTFVLYFLGILGNAMRWFVLLRAQDIEITYAEVLKIVLTGNFASNFLPSTVGGDTVRILSAARYAGWALSVASVVVDRLLNLLVMVTLLPTSWFMLRSLGSLIAFMLPWSSRGGRFFAGAVFANFVKRIYDSGVKWVKKLYAALLVWRHRLDAIFRAFVISWIARLVVFFAVWLLARGLDMQVALWQVIGIGALTNVLTVLPLSINGLGLREVTMAALYTQVGATLEQASTLVVVTRFILMIETLPGAFWISAMLVSRDEGTPPGPA